jgi:hypothetical protein
MAHQLLCEADCLLLDSNAIITRDRAIRNGEVFEFNAFGPAVAARVRVTPEPNSEVDR